MSNQNQVTAEFRPHVAVINGQIKTNSLKVAEHFSKRHDHVLRAIQNIECSNDFRLLNFGEASYEVDQPNGGKASYAMVEMTRDGFTFLAMGFTGKEAAKWKEAYINAFNRMEQELAGSHEPPQSPSKTQLLLTIDQKGNVTSTTPLGEDERVVRVNNLGSVIGFARETLPIEFIPDMMAELAQRLVRHNKGKRH